MASTRSHLKSTPLIHTCQSKFLIAWRFCNFPINGWEIWSKTRGLWKFAGRINEPDKMQFLASL